MTSWFLTADTRNYDDAEAAFGSVAPSHPLSWKARQIGALELAARWSIVDLTDANVRGGRASVVMSGLNWYLNRYVRLQLNVGWSHANGGPRPGDAAVLQTRFDLLI
jgi:phosphate-selective porin OprO/OprP